MLLFLKVDPSLLNQFYLKQMIRSLDDFDLDLPVDYLNKSNIFLEVHEGLTHSLKPIGVLSSGIILRSPVAQFARGAT